MSGCARCAEEVARGVVGERDALPAIVGDRRICGASVALHSPGRDGHERGGTKLAIAHEANAKGSLRVLSALEPKTQLVV